MHSPEDRVTKVWRTVELQNGLALDPNTVWSFILAAIKLVNFLRVWQFKGELPVPPSIPYGSFVLVTFSSFDGVPGSS